MIRKIFLLTILFAFIFLAGGCTLFRGASGAIEGFAEGALKGGKEGFAEDAKLVDKADKWARDNRGFLSRADNWVKENLW